MRYKPFLKPIVLVMALVVSSVQHVPTMLADGSAVRSVLFYSPSCGHCHYVITEVLPPIIEQYGDRLTIVGVDISTSSGQALYRVAVEHFNISDERLGVPTLIIGETVLVGSGEIPTLFPGLVEQYMAQGGIHWPDIPGLAEALPAEVEPQESTSSVGATSIDAALPDTQAESAHQELWCLPPATRVV